MLEKLLGPLTRRWPWLAKALAVQKRFGDLKGGYLASAVTLNLFLSIFPLLLLAIAVLGFITDNQTDIPKHVIANLGLSGAAATTMTDALDHAAQTKKAASVIGILGLAWAGLGVAAAIEYALDQTCQCGERGIKDKVRAFVWGVGAILIMGASIGVTALIDLFSHTIVFPIATIVVGIAINFIFWMWTFLSLSWERRSWHDYAPGALFAAIGLEILKQLAALLPGLFDRSSALYGSLGVVFGIIATLLIFGRLLVYASVINVINWERAQSKAAQ